MNTDKARPPATDIRIQPAVAALKLVLTYAMFAGLWILLSDKAVIWRYSDPDQIVLANTIPIMRACRLGGAITTMLAIHGRPRPCQGFWRPVRAGRQDLGCHQEFISKIGPQPS